MLISKVRLMVQALSFIILTYGGRVGISLGFAVPCFSCPYVAGCGGYCFLMFLQRVGIFGIAAYDTLLTYIGLKNILLKLLELAEQAGMRVVADDLCSSERALPGGVVYKDTSAEGMLRALAERYHKACVCPTFADNDRRINNILSITKENNLKGVVFNLLKGCHPYDIEAITIEKKLKEHGLKFLKLETDYGKEDSQNILTRLEAFRQTL